MLAGFVAMLCEAAGAHPVDGTFRLRALKSDLDSQLKARYLTDEEYRNRIKASVYLPELVAGETEMGFQVYNFATGGYEYRPGRFMAEGSHCRIFIERGKEGFLGTGSREVFAQVAQTFDEKVFPTVCRWFGKPVIPPSLPLPDEKIFIFLVDIRDRFENGYVAGYFDHRDIESLFGNQKPVFFMDISPGEPGNPDDKNNSFYRTLAHEFQHMVNFTIQYARGLPEQDRWLDEGFSMFSEYVFSGEIGVSAERVPPFPHFERFLENPSVNLLSNSRESWFHEDTLFRQYGASFLFVTYLIEKFGGGTQTLQQQFTRELVQTTSKGTAGIDELLRFAGTSFVEAFINFNMALAVDDATLAEGMWGFRDKQASFGKGGRLLPLKLSRHYLTGTENSFIGCDNYVLGNSYNVEELGGTGSVVLNLSCEAGLTPWFAEIKDNNSCSVRPIVLNSENKATLPVDLSSVQRTFLLPLALDGQLTGDERYFYSFKTTTSSYILYPVPNPAFSEQYLVFLKSFAGPLDTVPELSVTFNNLIEQPGFSPVDDEKTLFVAHYQPPGNGRGQAVCTVGDNLFSFSFSASRLSRSDRAVLQAGNAVLSLENLQIQDAQAMFAISDTSALQRPATAIDGPYDIFAPTGVKKTLSLTGFPEMPDKMGFCRVDANGIPLSWHPVRLSGAKTQAEIDESGRYCLFYDSSPPLIRNIRLERRSDRSLQLVIAAEDDLSGLAPEALTIAVDGEKAEIACPSSWPATVVLNGLRAGARDLSVEICDRAGNRARASITAQVAAVSGLRQTSVYPNPCRKQARIRITFDGRPVFAESEVRVFNSAGDKVARLPLYQIDSSTLQADWNLTDTAGRPVANGLYFYRARLLFDDRKARTSGTIAVLR